MNIDNEQNMHFMIMTRYYYNKQPGTNMDDSEKETKQNNRKPR